MTEPGKATRFNAAARGQQPDISGPTGTPGKSTLVGTPTSASAIGDPYIEDKPVEGQHILTATQRHLLVDAYQKRVESAAREFSVGLMQVRFDRILQKDDDLPLFMALMLDALAGVALSSLSGAFRLIRSGSDRAIGMGLEDMSIIAGELTMPMRSVSLRQVVAGADETAVGFIIKAAVDQTKKVVRGHSGPNADKETALDYISQMQDISVVAWQHQREDPPGYASDGDMIALFHAYDAARGHTAPRFAEAINAKIDRYIQSPTSRIGRNDAMVDNRQKKKSPGFHADPDVPDGYGGRVMRDLKVAWVQHSNGQRALHYYKLDSKFVGMDRATDDLEQLNAGGAYGFGAIDDRYKISAQVEPEFVETAIDRHRAIWGAEPTTKIVDDSTIPTWRKNRDINNLNQAVPGSSEFQKVDDNQIDANDPRTWVSKP